MDRLRILRSVWGELGYNVRVEIMDYFTVKPYITEEYVVFIFFYGEGEK